MGLLRKVHAVTLRDKLRSYEILKVLNVESLLQIERSQLYVGSVQNVSGNRVKSCWLKPQESDPEVV